MDLSAAQKRALLARKLRERSEAPLVRPMSPGQRRLWLLSSLVPGVPVNTVQVASRLIGNLDVAALRYALDAVVARHASLRTTFSPRAGGVVQLVAASGVAAFVDVDLSGEAGERDDLARRFADEQARSGFDLRRGPLVRASLARLAPAEHVLVLSLHRIVCDEWSLALVCDQLNQLYRERVTGHAAGPIPVIAADEGAATGQHHRVDDEALARALAYWSDHLAGAPALLAVPTDRLRPPVRSYRGARVTTGLSREVVAGLEALAASRGCTVFMVLLSALSGLLGRLAGQDDVVIGALVAGRGHPDREQAVGLLANVVPLRMSITGDPSFADLLGRAHAVTTGGLAHSYLPGELIVERLAPERSLASSPLFQAQLVVRNWPDRLLDVPGLHATPLRPFSGASMFDISLVAGSDVDGQLLLALEYSTELFDAQSIDQLLKRLVTLLQAGLAEPHRRLSDLDSPTGSDRWQVTVGFNATTRPLPDATTALDLIRAADPTAAAVVDGDTVLSYAELDALANRIAHLLRDVGVGPEVVVGLCVDRSASMLATLLAVWKAGGAYLPLDPTWPVDRLRFMVDDAGARILVTHASVRRRLGTLFTAFTGVTICLDEPATDIAASPGAAATPTRLIGESRAYVIYTSGSTGRPKGVDVPHRGVVNLLASFAGLLNLGPSDVFAAVTTLAFDISVLELLAPLTAGARVLIVDPELAADGVELRSLLVEHRATIMQATPATWRLLLAAGGVPTGLRVRLCGGEAMSRELADALLDEDGSPDADGSPDGAGAPQVWNVYGPTETTVWSAAGPVGRAPAPVVLGPPIGNTQCYVLDQELAPVPIGVAGSLYIGGHGVARGYHGRAALTADRFIPNPLGTSSGSRMYATGDLARYRHDGLLEFLGRTDRQVKLRGFRIELGEIEAVLQANRRVGQAVVLARGGDAADPRLVAYLVPREPADTASLRAGWPEVRARARRMLPEYMVPVDCVVLDALPLTLSGKTDRGALPPVVSRASGAASVAPRNALEEVLARIWREVLGVADLGVNDDFFELGGHSLLAAEVIAGIRAVFGIRIPLFAFFEHSTVAELTTVLTGLEESPGQVGATAERMAATAAPAEQSKPVVSE